MNYFKRKRIKRVEAYCCGMQTFKTVRLVILFDMFLNPCFKIITSFANIARTAARKSKLCTRKDFKLSRISSLYDNF